MRNRYLATFIAAALLSPALAFGDETKPVVVKNTPLPVTVVAPNPVPVTGSVSLSTSGPVPVSGTVNAAQSGPWSIAVTGPVTTVPAEDPAKNAFQATVSLDRCYEVPSGKRAVVEYASAFGNVEITNTSLPFGIVAIFVEASDNSNSVLHSVPITQIVRQSTVDVSGRTITFDLGAGATPMRAYADRRICASIFAGTFGNLNVGISGHLVSMP
jgi:hypothetical protein